MNAEIFAEWIRRQGHQVFRTASSYWYDAGPHVFQAFPYHWLISPSQEEINGLLRAHRIASVRYSTLFNSSLGKASYHIILHKLISPRSRQLILVVWFLNCEWCLHSFLQGT